MKKGIDCIGVFVSAVCHDGQGKFLMSKRSKLARDKQGHWEFGGGTVEKGESLMDALRREYKEEYSVELTDIKQVDTRDFIDSDGHWVGVFYVAKIVNPAMIVISDEAIETHDWFTVDSLPSPLMAGDADYLNHYVNEF